MKIINTKMQDEGIVAKVYFRGLLVLTFDGNTIDIKPDAAMCNFIPMDTIALAGFLADCADYLNDYIYYVNSIELD